VGCEEQKTAEKLRRQVACQQFEHGVDGLLVVLRMVSGFGDPAAVKRWVRGFLKKRGDVEGAVRVEVEPCTDLDSTAPSLHQEDEIKKSEHQKALEKRVDEDPAVVRLRSRFGRLIVKVIPKKM